MKTHASTCTVPSVSTNATISIPCQQFPACAKGQLARRLLRSLKVTVRSITKVRLRCPQNQHTLTRSETYDTMRLSYQNIEGHPP
jgi:hypothetical protein